MYALYRILGNSLPPRHEQKQTLTNLEFMLANESKFESCEKWWIVNRIVDAAIHKSIVDLLGDYGQKKIEIPFDMDIYNSISIAEDTRMIEEHLSTHDVNNPSTPELYRRAELSKLRLKNLYMMNNNGARNVAILHGRSRAKWILPWDSGCIISENGWNLITKGIEDHPDSKYHIVPMHRLAEDSEFSDDETKPTASEEPQIIFRNDADEIFDEARPYGRRPKVEMLVRLGVEGPWGKWTSDPWESDMKQLKDKHEATHSLSPGWVYRLSSGNSEQDVGEKSNSLRYKARNLAIYNALTFSNETSIVTALSTNPEISSDSKEIFRKCKVAEEEFQSFHSINLSNWKLTLPVGEPTQIPPPKILDYASCSALKPFMFDDKEDGSLVFYTYPDATTTNTSYSRTELREQLVPGCDRTNWKFADGGRMRGTLRMDDVSKDADGKYHRVTIMQIHGRLTDRQKEMIGQSDHNAPPILKIYWAFNKVRVLRKVLKNIDINDVDILREDSWTDEGKYFKEKVGFDKFSLEVQVSDGRMEITLNNKESMVFEDAHMRRWGIFDNYFKAGNYLYSTDPSAFAKLKMYKLDIQH